MYLPNGFLVVAPVDRRLTIWIGSLAALAALNVSLWFWLARSAAGHSSYATSQLVLSGIYVAVCSYRSLYPRVDLERICLRDSWLSSIRLGRTAATVAEVCFAWQCALFVQRLADMADLPMLHIGASILLPLVLVAELFCWHAVLSLNHIGHAFEESLWAVLMLVLAIACAVAAPSMPGATYVLLICGALVYGLGAALTLVVDVRMYVRRWRRRAGRYLPLATGFSDSARRRHPTLAWEVWREEAPWMTLYFSVGVWTSLAMVLL